MKLLNIFCILSSIFTAAQGTLRHPVLFRTSTGCCTHVLFLAHLLRGNLQRFVTDELQTRILVEQLETAVFCSTLSLPHGPGSRPVRVSHIILIRRRIALSLDAASTSRALCSGTIVHARPFFF